MWFIHENCYKTIHEPMAFSCIISRPPSPRYLDRVHWSCTNEKCSGVDNTFIVDFRAIFNLVS